MRRLKETTLPRPPSQIRYAVIAIVFSKKTQLKRNCESIRRFNQMNRDHESIQIKVYESVNHELIRRKLARFDLQTNMSIPVLR